MAPSTWPEGVAADPRPQQHNRLIQQPPRVVPRQRGHLDHPDREAQHLPFFHVRHTPWRNLFGDLRTGRHSPTRFPRPTNITISRAPLA